MQWSLILSVITWISRVVYIFLVVYYLGMLLLAILLIIRQGIVRLLALILRKRLSRRKLVITNRTFREKLQFIFNTSLLINDTLAISSIFFSFVIICELPIPSNFRLIVASMIVSVVPYFWGFTRSTGVGVNSGTIGAVLGLFWLAMRDTNLSWWQQTPYFLTLNLVANLSGWLGGFVGLGQIREAIAVTVFDVEVCNIGSSVQQFIQEVKKTIHSEFLTNTTGKLQFSEKKSDSVVAHTTGISDQCSLVSFRHELEWRRGCRPQLIAISWLFEPRLVVHSTNEIIDYTFNVWRYVTTEAIVLRTSHNSPDDARKLQLVVLTYKETPSIIWVDTEAEMLSLQISERLCDIFYPTEDINWYVQGIQFATLRKWHSEITLEQYSKHTPVATTTATQFISYGQLDDKLSVPPHILDEFISMSTFFDKIRGRTSAFIAFLITQIIFGVFINWLTELLTP